jgi:hypothetical protein
MEKSSVVEKPMRGGLSEERPRLEGKNLGGERRLREERPAGMGKTTPLRTDLPGA